MKNMKRNILLIPFVVVLTLAIIGFASANIVTSVNTDFNGVTLSSGTTMAGSVGDVVPVRVTFNALKNVSDVRDRKSTRLNSSHIPLSRMPSSA